MATSGNFSTSNQYIVYWIEWIENSYSIPNNTSNVTVKVWFKRTNTGYETYGTGSVTCTIDGTPYSASVTSSQKITSTPICLFSRTLDIGHYSDGSRNDIYVSASISLNVPLSSSTQGTTFGLTTIPRASIFASFPDFTIAGAANVAMVPVTTNYAAFTLNFSLYSGATLIGQWNGIAATVGNQTHSLTLTPAQQDEILKVITSAGSGGVALYCDTYSGGTKIGGTQGVGANCYIDASVVPTLSSVTAAEQNTAVTTLAIGAYVKGISIIKYTATASANKFATISSYKINYKGVETSLGGVNTFTTPTIDWTSHTVTVTVTDSRGRTASKTLALTALDYVVPTFSSFSVIRSDVNGLQKDDGTYVRVTSAGSITSLNAKNQWTYRLYSRIKGSTDWGTVKATASGAVGTTAFSYAATLSTYDIVSSYEFRLDLVDKFNTTISLNIIPTGGVILTWSDTGVGIGKVHSQGVLDVAGNTYVVGNTNVTGNETITGNLDVNGFFEQDGYTKHNLSGHKVYHNVASYTNPNASTTGTMIIRLPVGWTNTMMNIKITGYNYNIGHFELRMGGYNYDGGGSAPFWNLISAEASGVGPFGGSVRFGYEASTGKCVLLLGYTGSTWQYTHLNIETVQVSRGSVDSFGSGWSITISPTETGFTYVKSVSPYLTIYERWFSDNDTFTDPWPGTTCAIKAKGHISATGAIRSYNDYVYGYSGFYRMLDGKYGVMTPNVDTIRFIPQANPYLEINSPGNGSYGVNVWASDISLKENIFDSSYSALDKVMAIEHKSFDYISGGHIENGYVSQQLMQIDEDLVYGVTQEDGTKLYHPSVNTLIPAITKAMQEMKHIIDKQAALIEELRIKVGV